MSSNISGSLHTGRSNRKNSDSFPKEARKGSSFSQASGCRLHSVTVDHSVSGRCCGGAGRSASTPSLMSSADAPISTRILPGSTLQEWVFTSQKDRSRRVTRISTRAFSPGPQFQVLETS